VRIGLTGGGASVARMIDQAVEAEADGFSSLWYASAVGGDPMVAMALAGRATSTIELGTSVLQTYTCHPVLQANRAASLVSAIGRGFALGVGPSHRPVIEGAYGLSYDRPGLHTEEYVRVLSALLRSESVAFEGEELRVHGGLGVKLEVPVTLLVAALGPRLLRAAGQWTDGVILWMANSIAVQSHVVPRLTRAADAAGREAPRVVAGLPVAVHDDRGEARAAAQEQFALYGQLPNYQRILAAGKVDGPADAVIVGNEESVTDQIRALFDAGTTDFWAAPFPVGADRSTSRQRTRALLSDLAKTSA
jgi:F420-dependent oxidoreductase-like protein